jgi:hypothetical protein
MGSWPLKGISDAQIFQLPQTNWGTGNGKNFINDRNIIMAPLLTILQVLQLNVFIHELCAE